VVKPDNTMDVFWRTPSGGLGHAYWTFNTGWVLSNLPGEVAAIPHPQAITEAATNVKATTVTLNAKINPEGSSTTYWFEYGKSTAYGSKVPASGRYAGSGTSAIPFGESLVNLKAGTTYHYRVVAENAGGTTEGEDKTFELESLAKRLSSMAVTEPFNGSSESVANFGSNWSALGWAAGSPPKGSDTSTGWRPVSTYPTVNGAYYTTTVSDAGSGIASVATMNVNPSVASRYFSMWLDASGSASSRSGYELRFTDVSTNTYTLTLSKWVSGTQTVLAAQSNYSFLNSNSFALVDQGSTVSAWTNTGSGFAQLLSAGDASFSGGDSGVEGAGNVTALTNFKTGSL
jgi:hypothetical protein